MKLLRFALFAASALAEGTFDYTKLPQCAHQCLSAAETNCVPPAAPVTSQAIYQSCVCQSALLTGLHSSGTVCQTAGCSADDASKISQYYIALCAGPVVTPPASTSAAAATSTAATSTTSSTVAATAKADSGSKGLNATDKKKDWFSEHWKWVLMVIIIFLAMVTLWVGGTWLRRRHTRKKDAERANLAAGDAPYNPPTPGAGSKSSSRNDSAPQMAAAAVAAGIPGTPNGRPDMAAAGHPRTLRSRSSTLQSLGMGNSSRTHIPQPVVWGPHQHLARDNSNGSPTASVPPSPTSAIAPPQAALFRNRSSGRITPSRQVNFTPSSSADNVDHPRTHGNEIMGETKRHTLGAVRSDPTIDTHVPQSAEICDPSPTKLQKPQKH